MDDDVRKNVMVMMVRMFNMIELTLSLQLKFTLIGLEANEMGEMVKENIRDVIKTYFNPDLSEMKWIEKNHNEFIGIIKKLTDEMSDRLKTHISYYYNINNIKEEKE